MRFSNSCFFPSKFASHGFDWMAFFFLFRVMKNAFFPFTFKSTLVSMVWVDFLAGNDKCLVGRKICRMMHKVINSEFFFSLNILGLTNAYDYVHHACLKSGRRKCLFVFFKLLFYFILFSILLPNNTSLS